MKRAGEDDIVYSIDWKDSPKLLRKRSTYLSKRTLDESEKKFNEEFDKWFSRSDKEEQFAVLNSNCLGNIETTPPLLRVPLKLLRLQETPSSSTVSSNLSGNENHNDDDFVLARSLAESKKRMRKVLERRKKLSLLSNEPSHSSLPRSNQVTTTPRHEKLAGSQIGLCLNLPHADSPKTVSSTLLESLENRGVKRFKHCGLGNIEISPIVSRSLGTSVDRELNSEIIGFEEPFGPKCSTPRCSRDVNCISETDRNAELSPSRQSVNTNLTLHGSGNVANKNCQISKNGAQRTIANTTAITAITRSSVDAIVKRCSTSYDSMDDEEINNFLSQIPDKFSECCDEKISGPRNLLSGKICSQKMPLRRCKTLDQGLLASGTQKFLKPSAEDGKEDNEFRLRSASLNQMDSFWDDADFAGLDFSAIDEII